MDLQQVFSAHQSRRDVLRTLGMLAGIGLTLDACNSNNPPPPQKGSLDSIKHVLIMSQENRTFDTYFGYYPRAGKFGVQYAST